RQLNVERWAFDVGCFFCFCPAFVGDPKETQRMMFRRPGLPWLANDLVDEPTPPMPAMADSSGNSAGTRFKRDAPRIWEKNSHVKRHLLFQQPNNWNKRTLW